VAGEESHADSGGAVTQFKVSMLDVKIILERILKREILKFAAQMDERPSESASMINGQSVAAGGFYFDESTFKTELAAKKNGDYASEIIEQITTEYKQNFVAGEAEDTFQEMKDLLDIFYTDPDMNDAGTFVKGYEFCEITALFFDLAESMR